MIPDKFNMVDMRGIDLIYAQGEEVPGLYDDLVDSITLCRYQCLYNWYFDAMLLPPTYVSMSIKTDGVHINSGVRVDPEDIIHVDSLEIEPVLESLSVTGNGTYEPDEGVDGFSTVTVLVPDPPLQSKTCHPQYQDQTILPDEEYYGISSVFVYGDTNLVPGNIRKYVEIFGVTGSYEPSVSHPSNPNILCNWDFSNVVNTRGSSSYYTGYGTDGWGNYRLTTQVVTGGIKLINNPNYNFGLSGQTLLQGAAVDAMFGKTITISAMVDDQFGYYTFVASSSGDQDQGHLTVGGIDFYFYRDNATQMPFYMCVTSSDTDDCLIKAVKAEFGSTQTLAHQESGVWVLNENQTQDVEYFRVRATVKNS